MSEEIKEQEPDKPDKPDMRDLEPDKDPKAGGGSTIQPVRPEQ